MPTSSTPLIRSLSRPARTLTQRGHRYLTLVYQLDAGCRRLLWVGQERKITTLESFFTWFGKERSARLQVVCSDMWKAYLRVVKE